MYAHLNTNGLRDGFGKEKSGSQSLQMVEPLRVGWMNETKLMLEYLCYAVFRSNDNKTFQSGIGRVNIALVLPRIHQSCNVRQEEKRKR